MHQSKLIQLLQTLLNEEFETFTRFVQSPIYNRNKKAIELINLLAKYHPDYNSAALSHQKVFAKLYPDKPKTGTNLHQLMSELIKLLKRFWAVTTFENETCLQNDLLLDRLLEKNNFELFKSVFAEAHENLENISSVDNLYYSYRLESQYFTYLMRVKNKTANDNLQSLLDKIDCYTMALKMKMSVAALNRQRVLNKQYHLRFLTELCQAAAQPPFNEVLIIRLYHQIINLLIDPDNTQAYLELRSLLLKQGNNLLIDDKRQLYFLCANHEMWRTKNARVPNSLQLFFTFKEMVEAGIFDEFISYTHFTAIVNCSLENNEINWTKNFIKSFKSKLVTETDEAKTYIADYHNALLFFYENQLKKAKYLLTAQYPDNYYYLERKVLLLKIYYQNNDARDVDEFDKELKAVKMYLSRDNQLSEYNKNAYKNFALHLEKLYKLREKLTLNARKLPKSLLAETETLTNQIKNTQPLLHNTWLLQNCQLLLTTENSESKKK